MKRQPIDTLVYFDTNIYNHLLDNQNQIEPIKKAVSNRIVGIFVSDVNFEELLGTYRNNPQKAQSLFQLAWNICLHRATQPLFNLVKAEFRHLIDLSVRINVYSNDKNYANNFIDWWNLLAKQPNVKKDEIESTLQNIKENKYDFRDAMKLGQQKMKEVITKDNIKFQTPEEFLKEMLNKSSSVRDYINGFLSKVNNPQITVDMVRSNLSKMEGFRHSLYYYLLALVYHHNFAGGEPELGDSRDMHHIIYAGYSDIFVSDDTNLVKYLRYIPTKKHKYLKLDEFIQYLKTLEKTI